MLYAFFRNAHYVLLLILGLLVILLWPGNSTATPTIRHIEIDAGQFEYTPGRVEVNQGDRVIITLNAVDVVHGLYLDGYGLEARMVPGVSQQIEFTAEHTGNFRYRCSVSCGALHPFMVGELVVRPNRPFWQAAALTLLALGGMLFFLWRTPEKG